MDVTVRANNQVRHPYVQEHSSETDEAIDFKALISGFESASAGLGEVNGLIKPTQELTSGMAQYEHDSSMRADRDTIETDTASHDEHRHSDDDVETASKLLSERSERKDRDSSSDSGAVVSSVENELSRRSDNVSAGEQDKSVQEANALIQATEDVETVDLIKSATTPVQHAGDVVFSKEKHQANLKHQSVQQRRMNPDATQTGEQVKTIEAVLEQAMPEETGTRLTHAKTNQEPSELLKALASNEGEGMEVNDGVGELDTMSGEQDVPLSETKVYRPSTGSTSQKSDSASQEWSNLMMGPGMSSGIDKMTADTVKLSAKGRTIGTLMGGLSGTAKKTEIASRDLNATRVRTPVLPEQDLEDVDKLSVISQISDGLKMNFGKDQTLEVNLNPAELGRVRLQLEMQGDKTVNIKVSAEHAVIADLLNLNLNELRKDLLAQGVQINQIEVDVDARGQGSEQQEQQPDESEDHVDEQHAQELRDDGGNRRLSVTA
ncbi:MAG: flagellar hook-length control protein FliK [Bradymonadia bacterium]